MESSESKQVNQKLEVLGILKETVTIYVKNINFIIFTSLTSIPFFCVMFYFEPLLQKTVVDTPEYINPLFLPFENVYFAYPIELEIGDSYSFQNQRVTVKSFSNDYLPVLIQLVFIYLVPLHVLDLCSAVLTMDLASKLRSQENKISLKSMFQQSVDMSAVKGTFITYLYMLFLSTCFMFVFPWTVSTSHSFCYAFGGFIFFAVICFLAIAKLLMMYLEWSAIWNMSIIISVLDGIYGAGAFRVSYFLSSGNQRRGLLLMLVFFALGLCLRLSCLLFGCYKGGNGIFLQIGLLCVVNTLKWVSCTIYFHDCKERKMEKKELGQDLESNS